MASKSNAYIIGAGIAGLAAAAYLIKDGKFPGKNITIFEESSDIGGSFDANPFKNGYVMRGYRMFEKHIYASMFDLMSFIPTLENPRKSLKKDFFEFNNKYRIHSKCRLVENRKIADFHHLGLKWKDVLNALRLMTVPEFRLGDSKIQDNFAPDFFKSNSWFELCTSWAFQPWHSAAEFRRYLRRFIQDSMRIDTLTLIKSMRYNQYDSLVRPLVKWLKQHKVNFENNSKFTDMDFVKSYDKNRVKKLYYSKKGKAKSIEVREGDYVFATLGSMVANSSIGSMDSVPKSNKESSGSWKLWENLAKKNKQFGKPYVFNRDTNKSNFVSFTVTADSRVLPSLIEKFTGNKTGHGGIITFKDSNWLISMIVPHQPHFIGQDKNKTVFWAYGLSTDKKGNYVKKKMKDCNGRELLTELCLNFGFDKELPEILRTSVCIPCMLPYTTSHFHTRKSGDRPKVIPAGTMNLAFLGQFVEIPEDIVFTVEYSIRSAQIAVYSLLNLNKKPSPIYHVRNTKKIWYNAVKEMFR